VLKVKIDNRQNVINVKDKELRADRPRHSCTRLGIRGFRKVPKVTFPSAREAARGLTESVIPARELRNGNVLPAITVMRIPLRDEPSQSFPNQVARHVVEKVLYIPLERNKFGAVALPQPVLDIKIERVKLLNHTGGAHDRNIARAQQRDHEVDGTTGNREKRSQTVTIVAA
jgi:hypothetical protein